MTMAVWGNFLVVVVFIMTSQTGAQQQCPPVIADPKPWSDPASWPGGVPADGEDVEITTEIVLDTVTASLAKLAIMPGGKLIVDPHAHYTKIAAEIIVVYGELIIGSEECPHLHEVDVQLLGLKGETEGVEIRGSRHEKAIIVEEGGSLEIHGEPRQAWSRLTTTLHKTTEESVIGEPIFNHKDTDNQHDGIRGIIGYEFTVDGEMVQYLGRLSKTCNIAELITLQDSVIVMAVQRQFLLDSGEELDDAINALEQVCFGGQSISQARSMMESEENVAWSCICHVGHPENSVDAVGVVNGERSETSRLAQVINGKEFVAFSSVQTEGTWPYNLDILVYEEGTVPSEYAVLTLEHQSMVLEEGERIVISSTDYDWRQAEEFNVQPCPECNPGEFKLLRPFQYTHWGETTDGVNMGAEVALLTRNIRIFGAMEEQCYGDNNCDNFEYDTFGGHIKIFSNFTSVHIENAELYDMGQNSVIGSYPIHFHMCGDVSTMENRPYIKQNSIHNTHARCITIHDTSGMIVEGNAAYDSLGHCYFLEDGSEFDTEFKYNLGMSTRRTNLIPTDVRTASTFWITHPSTVMIGNVAAGSESWGIWYLFPRKPIGPSAELDLLEENQALRTPLAEFSNNVAHSNNEYGLRFDNILRPDGHAVGGFNYNPRIDPLDPNSDRVTTVFEGFTAFKNYKSVMIRGCNFVANNFTVAESVEGVKFLHSGPGAKRLANSLIVGETENKGKPEGWIRLSNGTRIWWDRQIRMNGADNALPIIGAIFYESFMEIENVEFRKFQSNIVRPAAAMGIKRANRWYTSPANNVKSVTFDYVDPEEGNRFYDASEGRGFEDLPSNINTVIRDIDGSLTTYPGSTIVKPYDFLLNARCAEVPQWNMHVCPAMFTKMFIIWADARLNTFITRNDQSASFSLSNNHAHLAYALNSEESYILHFNTTVPRRMFFRVSGVQSGVSQVIGICVGRNSVVKTLHVQGVTVPSVHDLHTATSETTRFFHDTENGIIFFRFASAYQWESNSSLECPGDEHSGEACPSVFLELEESSDDGDCSNSAYPLYAVSPLGSEGGLTTPVFS